MNRLVESDGLARVIESTIKSKSKIIFQSTEHSKSPLTHVFQRNINSSIEHFSLSLKWEPTTSYFLEVLVKTGIFSILLYVLFFLSTLLVEVRTNEKISRNLADLSLKLSHDIRSPLATLMALSSKINIENPTEASLFGSSLNRLKTLADSLLLHAKDQKLKPTPKYFVLTQTCKDVCLEMDWIARQNYGARVLSEFPLIGQNLIKGSEIEFKRALINFIQNALEASPKGADVHFQLFQDRNQTIIEIRDSGPGISETILESFRNKRVTTKENGTGLGLSISVGIIERLNGAVEIVSREKGTTVRIAIDTITTNSIAPGHVLIDDDITIRKTWEIVAKKNSIELKSFSSVQKFLAASEGITSDSNIYLDYERGDSLSLNKAVAMINAAGFSNLWIATGHTRTSIEVQTGILGFLGKEPPFI